MPQAGGDAEMRSLVFSGVGAVLRQHLVPALAEAPGLRSAFIRGRAEPLIEQRVGDSACVRCRGRFSLDCCMSRPQRAAGWISSRASLWFGIGSLFVLVSVLAGPRALANISAQWSGQSLPAVGQVAGGKDSRVGRESARPAYTSSVEVDIGRVGFAMSPEWMHGDVALAVMESLGPALDGPLDLMDEAGAQALRARLQGNPWVRYVGLKRRYPDRFQLELELRRPELAVRSESAARSGEELSTGSEAGDDGGVLAIVDRDGIVLPLHPADPALPWTFLEQPNPLARPGEPQSPIPSGAPFPDPRILAAAAVAAEVRREFRALCPDMPPLAAIDANNLDYRYVAGRGFSEVRIALRASVGRLVWLAWGHAPATDAPRVPVATKADVLRQILVERPGLTGLARGDLRFANRWRDWLIPTSQAQSR